MRGPTYVVALGASTAVGRDAWASAAAVRAGVSGFTQHPYMIDSAGEPMRVAIAPWLEIELVGARRFEALLFPAIDQALAPVVEAQSAPIRIALALGFPSPRPGLPSDLLPSVVRTLRAKYHPLLSAVAAFPNGHAAGLVALKAAAQSLAVGEFDAFVVAGIDSYMEPETLEWLEENDQLHSAGPLNNAWGFIPGEGAGAFLIARSETLELLRLVPLAKMLGVATAFEQNHIKSQTICLGEGLTSVFQEALAISPPGIRITDTYCDMNGEPYRADEYGFSCLRCNSGYESASSFVAPADCWGDVSASSASLLIAVASIAALKGYANGRYPLIWASSECGERAAAIFDTTVSK